MKGRGGGFLDGEDKEEKEMKHWRKVKRTQEKAQWEMRGEDWGAERMRKWNYVVMETGSSEEQNKNVNWFTLRKCDGSTERNERGGVFL